MKTNGAAVGDIAPAEWHGLRVVNILVDYAQMRMRLSSSRAQPRSRHDPARHVPGSRPGSTYSSTPAGGTGKVYEVGEGQGASGHASYSTDRPTRPH